MFDFFGTLVPNFSLTEHKAVLREMAAIMGAPAEGFVQGWLTTFNQRVTGQYASVAGNIEAVCVALGVPVDAARCAEAVALRLDYTRRHLGPRTAALPVLREVRSRGLKVGLISDCSGELPQLWRETIFAEWFDVALFSCVEKVKKPNPVIYQRAAERLGVSCAECLFVGDGGSNELAGAQAAGMRPLWLFVREEQGTQDTHRVDGQSWSGDRINDLRELLPRLDASQPIAR